MMANQRMPMLHNEGLMTRNYTTYDFHVLVSDDVYMLWHRLRTVTGQSCGAGALGVRRRGELTEREPRLALPDATGLVSAPGL